MLGCPLNSDGTSRRCPAQRKRLREPADHSQSSADHEQVITARIDHNIDVNNMVWYRFQSDTGLQAAYTDPINPLFNAISSQPLYSFAAGYTHIFSQNLVNYFNPAFSWYESLFGPVRFEQDAVGLSHRSSGHGSNAPFTTMGGLDYIWVQGRRATRFQSTTISHGPPGQHQFRFGVSARRLRSTTTTSARTHAARYLHDAGAIHLRRRVHRNQAFPIAASQPFNYLNVDLFAQDTMKLSRR